MVVGGWNLGGKEMTGRGGERRGMKCGFMLRARKRVEFRWEGDDERGGRKVRDEMWFMLRAGMRVVHIEGEECCGILNFIIIERFFNIMLCIISVARCRSEDPLPNPLPLLQHQSHPFVLSTTTSVFCYVAGLTKLLPVFSFRCAGI